VLTNQGFTKILFDKRDFNCLAAILATNLATFKERMQHHGYLQAQFTTLYRENGRKEYEVAELRKQMQQLENENERLKSKMIEVR
jgi:predicted nuclease with TOPRIM domain